MLRATTSVLKRVPRALPHSTSSTCTWEPPLPSGISIDSLLTNIDVGKTATQKQVTTKISTKAFINKPPMSPTTALTIPHKPWPYALPKFLQPRAGTTYHTMHGHGSDAEEPVTKPGSILQAILYGIPEPDGYQMRREVVKGKFVKHLLYGFPEEELGVLQGGLWGPMEEVKGCGGGQEVVCMSMEVGISSKQQEAVVVKEGEGVAVVAN